MRKYGTHNFWPWVGGTVDVLDFTIFIEIPNGMQSHHDLSYLVIIFQNTQSHRSMVSFVTHNPHV